MAPGAHRLSVTDLITDLSAAAEAKGTDLSAPERDALQTLSDELLALQSIYAATEDGGEEEEALKVVQLSADGDANGAGRWRPGCKIRLELKLPLDLSSKVTDDRPSALRLSILLPPGYPASTSPPQLQLLDRFLGPFEVDSALFSKVIRTFLVTSPPSNTQCDWRPDPQQAVLFEGCETVQTVVAEWYEQQARQDRERRAADGRAGAGELDAKPSTASSDAEQGRRTTNHQSDAHAPASTQSDPALLRSVAGKTWVSTEALVDRKSSFIGHAVRVDQPAEVPLLLTRLSELHPRMEKATHPMIRAWVCKEERSDAAPLVHRDCDDDGESAAGGRLAHLLDALRCENALVVVTRYYGGIHLGADRFKLINRVARDALEQARLI
ncbi:unnamed protein product [Parajaminaea phylloscopi]